MPRKSELKSPRGSAWIQLCLKPAQPWTSSHMAQNSSVPGSLWGKVSVGVRTGSCHMGAEGGGRVVFSWAYLNLKSCSHSSAVGVVEVRSSRSWFCSRSVEKDCFLRSFLWVAVSLRSWGAERPALLSPVGTVAAPRQLLAASARLGTLPRAGAPGPWAWSGRGPKQQVASSGRLTEGATGS